MIVSHADEATGIYVCRACGGTDVRPLLDLGSMPIAHRLLERADAAEATFPFRIACCRHCGLMQMTASIDPALLYGGYNYNFSSWKPEPHRPDEIRTIVQHAAPRAVAEIGANDGLFLSEVRDAGVAIVAGIEPNPASGSIARERGLDVASGMATPELAAMLVERHGPFDCVVSRQVLEHIPDVTTFFRTVDTLLRPDGFLFIDVPDMEPAADLGDLSVLWEEHVTYFTRATLHALFRAHGYEPLVVKTYDFSGGALAVLARRTGQRDAVVPADPVAVERAERFATRVAEYRARLQAALDAAVSAGKSVAIYGAGVRACTLVNALRLRGLTMSIDDQTERQGKLLPGARVPIVASPALAESGATIVLLAVNNENETRVTERIRSIAGDDAFVVSVCGPRDLWAELARLEAHAGAALPA